MPNWAIYAKAKKHLMDGVISVASGAFRISLHTSASNAAKSN